MPTKAWVLLLLLAAPAAPDGKVTGELKKWHRITVTFDGPETGEQADPNPFRDSRLSVTFRRGSRRIVVPGYYAADGNAGRSGADRGRKWRVHFSPDEEGEWSYAASFRRGKNVALSLRAGAGEPGSFDGARGTFTVGPSDKKGRDHRAKGRLRYVGRRYLRFAESGEYFLKGGADSPENFLGYFEFDQTPGSPSRDAKKGEAKGFLHRYGPHRRDWKEGDPTWKNGKGKNIIGALNYLASKGMNSVYFLTMNVGGDGKDVWMWTDDDVRDRFDVSKLDQWEIVFSHMDRLGLMLHVITQEQENDQLLDGGALGPERRLYFRELIARFGHHLAVTWNLGEENTNTDARRRAYCEYFQALDPYDHPIVVHTFPKQYDKVYRPLLGYPHFQGPSLQMGDMTLTHSETVKWVRRSAATDRKWFVSLDEIGPAKDGVVTDAEDPGHDEVRKHALWGNLIGGGAGCEWYFGYRHPHNDLNCEDWRSRDKLWDMTRVALDFFEKHLPYPEMVPADEFSSAGWCLAKRGEVYAVYLPDGGWVNVGLGKGTYSVKWYDPRKGGPLQDSLIKTVRSQALGESSIGGPPGDSIEDWVALVRRTEGSGEGATAIRTEFDTRPPKILSFTLINADSNKPVAGYDPLKNGTTLDLAKLPANLSLRANTEGPVPGVRFALDGNREYHFEGIAPYTIAGDSAGDYNPWEVPLGAHTLTATPEGGGVSHKWTFKVIGR